MDTAVSKVHKKKKLGKKIGIAVAVILVVVIAVGVKSVKGKSKVNLVSVSKVEKKTLIQSVSITGVIEPINKSEIALNSSQKVEDVMVKEGQTVKKGDKLIKLDTEDYEYQLKKAQLSCQTTSDSINKTLSSAERNDKTTLESAVKSAEIAVESAVSSLNDANEKLKQNAELLKGGYISQSEYDTSKKSAADLKLQLDSAKLKLSNAKNSLSNFDVNSKDKVNDLIKQNDAYKLDIDNLNSKIKGSVITSNIDGTVVKCDALKGEYPATGDVIIIHDTKKLVLSADINQYDAVKLKKGQKAEIEINGINKKYEGTLSQIGSFAQKSSGTASQENKVNVKITITNPDDNIKCGYEGDADIIITQKENVLAVDFDSIKKSGNDKYVLTAENGIVKKKAVKTGLETEMYVEVTDGLKDGEEIIANPSQTLKVGDKVTAAGVNKK